MIQKLDHLKKDIRLKYKQLFKFTKTYSIFFVIPQVINIKRYTFNRQNL